MKKFFILCALGISSVQNTHALTLQEAQESFSKIVSTSVPQRINAFMAQQQLKTTIELFQEMISFAEDNATRQFLMAYQDQLIKKTASLSYTEQEKEQFLQEQIQTLKFTFKNEFEAFENAYNA